MRIGYESVKQTGIVRRIDDLGRVVIPKEIRHNYRIHADDPLEIFCTDTMICLKKYSLVKNIPAFTIRDALRKNNITGYVIDKDKNILAGTPPKDDLGDLNFNFKGIKELKNEWYLLTIRPNNEVIGAIIFHPNNDDIDTDIFTVLGIASTIEATFENE